MALAIVVTLEKELPEAAAAYAKAGSGKALARESERLDTAARACKVTALTSLLSESQAALAEHVEANLNNFKQPNPILRDLKAAEALLAAAEAAGVRFHFTKTNL